MIKVLRLKIVSEFDFLYLNNAACHNSDREKIPQVGIPTSLQFTNV